MAGEKIILVIDDDVQLVDSVETLLTSVGYRVEHAYQSKRGMEIAKRIKPDLILLDIMFAGPPGPDGIELSRKLNQDAELAEIPVIILSGVRKVLDYPIKIFPDERWMPVKAFLEKPVRPDTLLGEIEKVLGPRGQ
jgi:DNA-binding response OmpR family regulator